MAQHYAPEEVSGAVLATELAEELAKRGHKVSFVTCAPNYPYGRIFQGYKNSILKKEERNGVKIFRTWSYISPKRSLWARLLNWITFSLSAFWGGLAAGKPDVIFSYSPPMPLGGSAWLLSLFWNVPWILRVEDLFPDAAIATGLITNKVIIRFLYATERFLYKKAAYISLISEGFRNILIKKGIPQNKLSVTPVWVNPQEIRPLPKDNEFRKENNLIGKFVVLYSGNLGETSDLEDVLSAAKILLTDPIIRFVFIGEGSKKAFLLEKTQELGLSNVQFFPFQPRERYAMTLAAADLGLVTLNSSSASFSLPSKTFNIMASGRPVIAISPEESEIAKLINKYECGVNVKPGESDLFSQVIQNLRSDNDKIIKMGNNGRSAIENDFTLSVAVRKIEKLLLRAIKS